MKSAAAVSLVLLALVATTGCSLISVTTQDRDEHRIKRLGLLTIHGGDADGGRAVFRVIDCTADGDHTLTLLQLTSWKHGKPQKQTAAQEQDGCCLAADWREANYQASIEASIGQMEQNPEPESLAKD